MNVTDLIALLTALTAVTGAVSALIVQLRTFRREIVSAVERHMVVTQENQELLRKIERNGK